MSDGRSEEKQQTHQILSTELVITPLMFIEEVEGNSFDVHRRIFHQIFQKYRKFDLKFSKCSQFQNCKLGKGEAWGTIFRAR
jgi:hypothetical protein